MIHISGVLRCTKLASNAARLILLRNGESTANVDISAYCATPDWRIPLTKCGIAQARDAGRDIAGLAAGGPVYVYFSPYLRSLDTMKHMVQAGTERESPLDIIGIREDARLRDGDIGRFVNGLPELKECLAERERYGKFFYRFPHGESGADVCDRVTSFLDAFRRERLSFPENTTAVMVTHGLTIRLFIKRWFHLNVDTFHQMTSPPPGKHVVLSTTDGSSFKLCDQSLEMLNLPASLTDDNGYAFRNKGTLGSVSIGAPYV